MEIKSKNHSQSLTFDTLESRAMARERRYTKLQLLTTALLLGDAGIVIVSLLVGFQLRFNTILSKLGMDASFDSTSAYMPQFFLAFALMMGALVVNDHYGRVNFLRPTYSAWRLMRPILAWACVLLLVSLTLRVEPSISRMFVICTTIVLLCLMPTWRYLFTRHFVQRYFLDAVRRNTLVIGWNPRVQQLTERAEAKGGSFPFSVKGIITNSQSVDISGLPAAIPSWQIESGFEQVIINGDYDTVLLSNSGMNYEQKKEIQQLCAREMLDFIVMPNHIATLTRCLHVETIQGIPLLTQARRPLDHIGNALLKRCWDIVGSLFGLVMFAPVIAFFCWRVRRESPGPVFYRQTRVGRNGQPFKIIKIRSMRLDAEEQTGAKWCVENDPRRLKVGAFMRRMNIDELPQFWNVLKGEMSLVGPRPERPELIEGFKSEIDYYNLRHTIKPGLTGWAQVNGWRGDTSLVSRIGCDIEYIERASVWFDFYIMLRTFINRENAY
ncbi:sugar transferase [Coraliomargarita sp. SDUM461003]|uniref:Sugar transferase n=1 Tax=Thalassobacterium maritimum TaxID=3041265 RepID=A0ABU1AVV8_9BACT|nr:sugar transferase [Coraliomargarita sp. SDUM461003]MDQ8208221.1 sugar transferase [Coraliomargarita sp. SDUM461003]